MPLRLPQLTVFQLTYPHPFPVRLIVSSSRRCIFFVCVSVCVCFSLTERKKKMMERKITKKSIFYFHKNTFFFPLFPSIFSSFFLFNIRLMPCSRRTVFYAPFVLSPTFREKIVQVIHWPMREKRTPFTNRRFHQYTLACILNTTCLFVKKSSFLTNLWADSHSFNVSSVLFQSAFIFSYPIL